MPCTTHEIDGPPQSGKTSIALGFLERLQGQGVPVAYVLPSEEWARDAKRRTSVPCMSWRAVVSAGDFPWRALAVEQDMGWDPVRAEQLRSLQQRLASHEGPTQMVLIRNR